MIDTKDLSILNICKMKTEIETLEKKREELVRSMWTRGAPPRDGWYWIWNGEARLVVVVRNNILYLRENDPINAGYPLNKYPDIVNMWFMSCDPPEPPK